MCSRPTGVRVSEPAMRPGTRFLESKQTFTRNISNTVQCRAVLYSFVLDTVRTAPRIREPGEWYAGWRLDVGSAVVRGEGWTSV